MSLLRALVRSWAAKLKHHIARQNLTGVFAVWLAFVAFPHTVLAKVDVTVEPYLGYSKVQLRDNLISETLTGAVLGGKGGFSTNSFFMVLDFHFGGPYVFKANDSNYTNWMWGLGAGYPGKSFRFYAGYYFRNVLEDVDRNLRYLGGGLKASLGYMFKSKISFNIEYVTQTFNKVQGTFFSQDTEIDDIHANVTFLSISAPLEIN